MLKNKRIKANYNLKWVNWKIIVKTLNVGQNCFPLCAEKFSRKHWLSEGCEVALSQQLDLAVIKDKNNQQIKENRVEFIEQQSSGCRFENLCQIVAKFWNHYLVGRNIFQANSNQKVVLLVYYWVLGETFVI